MWKVSIDIKRCKDDRWRLVYKHSWGWVFKRVTVILICETKLQCVEEALELLVRFEIAEAMK